MRVLVIRNDKLGDFMLSWPAFRALKSTLPSAQIVALVPEYTQPMAELCPWIDQVLVDAPPRNLRGVLGLARSIRKNRFDAVITLFSTSRIGLACLLAGISYRLAPATKIAQVFYNHRLTQRRSRSEKPEFEYNVDLIAEFLHDHHLRLHYLPAYPLLQFPEAAVAEIRQRIAVNLGIPEQSKLVFVHAGSGGSANNLTMGQYADLCGALRSTGGHAIVLTAGPGEEEAAHRLGAQLGQVPHMILEGLAGLVEFAKHLQAADLFISGSTGPLHIAGALNRPTAAFYPGHRSATALRWQTLNAPDRRLAFSPPETGDLTDVSRIDVAAAAGEISQRFLA